MTATGFTDAAGRTGIHVLALDAPRPADPADGATKRVRVPQLAGLSLRDAAYRAHTAGLRIEAHRAGHLATPRGARRRLQSRAISHARHLGPKDTTHLADDIADLRRKFL